MPNPGEKAAASKISWSERKDCLNAPENILAGSAVSRIRNVLEMRNNLEVIIHLEAVHDFQHLFAVMLSALSVTGSLPFEQTIGNAQEVIFTGREEPDVGAHGEFSGIAQVLFGGKSGARVNGQRLAGGIFNARDMSTSVLV